MGATVVICQFGKMESFAGKEGVAAFTEAYEKLIARLNPEKKRRIALVVPMRFGDMPKGINLPDMTRHNAALLAYTNAIRTLAGKFEARVLDPNMDRKGHLSVTMEGKFWPLPTRDGIHLDPHSKVILAQAAHDERLLRDLDIESSAVIEPSKGYQIEQWEKEVALHNAIDAKNRLWFHYTRPQNWAFLAGNRTNQPSSRDHLDPTKRWFPEEMEQWLPLIEAKEQEIWKLAEAPR
jgi:hypothetical protein